MLSGPKTTTLNIQLVEDDEKLTDKFFNHLASTICDLYPGNYINNPVFSTNGNYSFKDYVATAALPTLSYQGTNVALSVMTDRANDASKIIFYLIDAAKPIDVENTKRIRDTILNGKLTKSNLLNKTIPLILEGRKCFASNTDYEKLVKKQYSNDTCFLLLGRRKIFVYYKKNDEWDKEQFDEINNKKLKEIFKIKENEVNLTDFTNISLLDDDAQKKLIEKFRSIRLITQSTSMLDKECTTQMEKDYGKTPFIAKYGETLIYLYLYDKKEEIWRASKINEVSNAKFPSEATGKITVGGVIAISELPVSIQNKINDYDSHFLVPPLLDKSNTKRIILIGATHDTEAPIQSTATDLQRIVQSYWDDYQCAWLDEIPLIAKKTPKDWQKKNDSEWAQFVDLTKANDKLYFYLSGNKNNDVAFKYVTDNHETKTCELNSNELSSVGLTQDDIDQLINIIKTQQNKQLLQEKFFPKILLLARKKGLTRIPGVEFTVLTQGFSSKNISEIDGLITLKELLINSIEKNLAPEKFAASSLQEDKGEQMPEIQKFSFSVAPQDIKTGKELAQKYQNQAWPERIKAIVKEYYGDRGYLNKKITFQKIADELLAFAEQATTATTIDDFHQAANKSIAESLIKNSKRLNKPIGTTWKPCLIAMEYWVNADYSQKIDDLTHMYDLGARNRAAISVGEEASILSATDELRNYIKNLFDIYNIELNYHHVGLPAEFITVIEQLRLLSNSNQNNETLNESCCKIITDLYQQALFPKAHNNKKLNTLPNWVWKYIDSLADTLIADHIYRLQKHMQYIVAKEELQPREPEKVMEEKEEKQELPSNSTDISISEFGYPNIESAKPIAVIDNNITLDLPIPGETGDELEEEKIDDNDFNFINDDINATIKITAKNNILLPEEKDSEQSDISLTRSTSSPSSSIGQTFFGARIIPASSNFDNSSALESKEITDPTTGSFIELRNKLLSDRDKLMQREFDIQRQISLLKQECAEIPDQIDEIDKYIRLIDKAQTVTQEMTESIPRAIHSARF